MPKYTIGVDFGTLSGRAVLVDVSTGEERASAVFYYPHAVMETQLPSGAKLGQDWALQNPKDYVDVLIHTIPEILRTSKVNVADVIGIGTDFTACTILPVYADGTPLCLDEKYKNSPHAYVKLWKHHGAQDKADKLNALAKEMQEPWLVNYGGKISSEWVIPKLMEVVEQSPEIYNVADRWIEAADWIVWVLTGIESRNVCTAGYKAIWNKKTGYPNKAFFKALDPCLENVVSQKLGTQMLSAGTCAGGLSEKMAQATGLNPGIAVSVGNVDAHVCVAAVGISEPGKMLAIMGTSTCHIVMGEAEMEVPGMCGMVADGVMPGLFGYEAGQSCVGDHFAWFIANCLPDSYVQQANAEGKNIHTLLQEKAENQKPGESGLLALDWWNGNRSVLVNVDLSGLILGMTLATKPEEIYRALIEATAFGTREIIENFRNHGVPIDEFFASGGISQKNSLAMQIYADILNMPIKIAGSLQGPALGSAIFASVAAGEKAGGYNDVFVAAKTMGKIKDKVYIPLEKNVKIYNKLFCEYKVLHDYFGRGENNVMKRLKEIKQMQGVEYA